MENNDYLSAISTSDYLSAVGGIEGSKKSDTPITMHIEHYRIHGGLKLQ